MRYTEGARGAFFSRIGYLETRVLSVETNETVLAVDDDPRLLKSICIFLEEEGYRVLTAKDGLEALAILEEERVDLILADIAMPRMNGYQLYERVRENPEWVTIPFILLTARAMDSDIRYGKALGVDDYLTKPFYPDDLFAAVRGKLRRARQLAQRFDQPDLFPKAQPDTLTLGALKVARDKHLVWMDGEQVKLSARELELLKYMAERVEQVISPPELIQVTHGLETDYTEAGNLLRPLIRSLRRKLGYPVGDMGCIENVRGVGYRLTVPEG